ncbi:15119_t:CDS:2 [Entrophospora sp. SA101]|nr:4664_t:CDS:2 [Entrophospora sp. SA101]CAJ0756895.1 15119_t:CDS:2 [Entrophospora sp. SA101]CAJ0826868.1 7157_t:CDS:2 [Entrophospora sp. SA101]CAJ0888676.1 2084_t:CDS:2 [Entrophospora sp. SA101]
MYYRYQKIKIIFNITTIPPSFKKRIFNYPSNNLSSRSFHTATTLKVPTTTTGVKPDLKLLQKLRQETSISLSKAKEALVKHNNDYNKAKEWLIEDSKISGQKKAEKLKDRIAKEGLIGVVLTKNLENNDGLTSTTRGAIVEVSCETDFVSRNLLFQQLVAQIASTTLFLSNDIITNENNNGENKIPTTKISDNDKIIINPISPLVLNTLPLLPHPSSNSINNNSNATTIQQSIMDIISKLGENIVIRRAEVVGLKNNYDGDGDRSLNNNRIVLTGGYVHGGDSMTGRIGGLVVVEVLGQNLNQSLDSTSKLIQNIARQIVGYNPKYIDDDKDDKIISSKMLGNYNNKDEFLRDNVLLYQDFLYGGGTVKQVLENFKNVSGAEIKILDFKRWECGEEII